MLFQKDDDEVTVRFQEADVAEWLKKKLDEQTASPQTE